MARPSAANIVVIGSLNVDLIAQVDHLPKPGDTVAATQLVKRFGGKGGNQALAAARQGAQVMFIGNLGDDPDGRDYRNHLRREGINCSSLNNVKGVTGNAYITVDQAGENQIVVIPGANGVLTGPSIKMQRARIAVAKMLLLQLEIPMDAAVDAIRIANEAKVAVVLNASPVLPKFPWGDLKFDVVIVNENEARQIFDLTPSAAAVHHDSWKERLTAKRIRHLIITRGGSSTLLISKTGVEEVLPSLLHLWIPSARVTPLPEPSPPIWRKASTSSKPSAGRTRLPHFQRRSQVPRRACLIVEMCRVR
jgi:ribokinase